MDAVCREHLIVFEAVEQVVVVGFTSFVVGLLDRAARRGVVAGNGQSNGRPVREGNLLLNQPLTKGAAADDGTPVVVLQGTGQNFAG